MFGQKGTSFVDLQKIQQSLQQSTRRMRKPWQSGTEIMLALTEEAGEVATEVALLESIGSKAEWQKEPSTDRLADEIIHLLNTSIALANFYGIDLAEKYAHMAQSDDA